MPERPVDDALVGFEMIAIGDRELAADRHAPLPHLIGPLEIHFLPRDADHPRPQHRDQLKLAGAVRRIAEVDLFAGLPPANLETAMRAATVRDVAAGTVVIRQGDEADEFYVIDQGRVEVTQTSADGGKPRMLR